MVLIGSPEFNHNAHALWGFASGIASGGLLALSMVFVRKTHEVERVALFPMMMVLSFGGALSLIVPALIFDSNALYPTQWRDIGLVLIYGVVMQCLAWGDDCLCNPAAFPFFNRFAAAFRARCRFTD